MSAGHESRVLPSYTLNRNVYYDVDVGIYSNHNYDITEKLLYNTVL